MNINNRFKKEEQKMLHKRVCLTFCLVTLFALMGSFAREAFASPAISVSPVSLDAYAQADVQITVTGLVPGASATIERWIDANQNGYSDQDDVRQGSVVLTDGSSSLNRNVSGDVDGLANGTISTSVNFHPLDVTHIPGHYLFRVTSGGGSDEASFQIAPAWTAQSISGEVVSGGGPVKGAVITAYSPLLDTEIAYATTDPSGNYQLYLPDEFAGIELEIAVYYMADRYYSNFFSGSVVSTALATGENKAGVNLELYPQGNATISGYVRDSSTNAGIAGVWVDAESTVDEIATGAMTDENGYYEINVPAGTYLVGSWPDTFGMVSVISRGYVGFDSDSAMQEVSVTTALSGVDFAFDQSTTLLQGKVLDAGGNPVPGYTIQAFNYEHPNGVAAGAVSGADGSYTLGMKAYPGYATWRIDGSWNEDNRVNQAYISDPFTFDPSTGPTTRNLIVQEYTAWVNGSAKLSNSDPALDEWVYATRPNGSWETGAEVMMDDGSFTFPLVAGEWVFGNWPNDGCMNAVFIEKDQASVSVAINTDGNSQGVCDDDLDNDGVTNGTDWWVYGSDNCPATPNADQADVDGNGIGDACDTADYDQDGLADYLEVRIGSSVDSSDSDGDGISDGVDSQPLVSNNPITDDVEFVKQVYRDFLNREADAGGLAYWTGELAAGRLTRAAVVENYLLSPEFGEKVAPVTRLYFAYFRRLPDYAGLMYWVSEYGTGRRTLNDISGFFATSPEFQSTYGNLSNGAFVDLIYTNLFSRTADPGGRAFWTSELDSSNRTRGQVMVGFSESAEYKNLMANRIYVTMTYIGLLRRAPEQGGFDYWVDRMDQGDSGQILIDLFLNSAEYSSRFGVTHPNDIDDDGDGYTENQGDCNDGVYTIHPFAAESCQDGVDQDCNGSDLICPVTDTVFTPVQCYISPPPGVSATEFSLNALGEITPAPTGAGTILVYADGVAFVVALQPGRDFGLMNVIVTQATTPPSYRAAFAEWGDMSRPLEISARTTAVGMLFVSPYFTTTNASRAADLLTIMENDPKVAALADVIEQVFTDTDPFANPALTTALQEAVVSVWNSVLEESPAAAPMARMMSLPVTADNGVYYADQEFIQFEDVVNDQHNFKVSTTGGNVDWVARVSKLDPELIESWQNLKSLAAPSVNPNARRSIYEDEPGQYLGKLFAKGESFVQKLDVVAQAMDKIFDAAETPGEGDVKTAISVPADTHGVYLVRAFSGAFGFQDDSSERSFVWNDLPGPSESLWYEALFWNLLSAALEASGGSIDTKIISFENIAQTVYPVIYQRISQGKTLNREDVLDLAWEVYDQVVKGLPKNYGFARMFLSKSAAKTLVRNLNVFSKAVAAGQIMHRVYGIAWDATPMETMVTVVGNPFPPLNVTIDNDKIDATNLEIGWTIDEGIDGGYYIYYTDELNPDPTNLSDWEKAQNTCYESPCMVTGLEPDTEYTFVVSSLKYDNDNLAIESDPSDLIKVKTLRYNIVLLDDFNTDNRPVIKLPGYIGNWSQQVKVCSLNDGNFIKSCIDQGEIDIVSSEPEVVLISSGVATGLKKGTTTVSVIERETGLLMASEEIICDWMSITPAQSHYNAYASGVGQISGTLTALGGTAATYSGWVERPEGQYFWGTGQVENYNVTNCFGMPSYFGSCGADNRFIYKADGVPGKYTVRIRNGYDGLEGRAEVIIDNFVVDVRGYGGFYLVANSTTQQISNECTDAQDPNSYCSRKYLLAAQRGVPVNLLIMNCSSPQGCGMDVWNYVDSCNNCLSQTVLVP